MNELIGLISLAIAVISYSLYITHTLKGYTKPHAAPSRVAWPHPAPAVGFCT